MGVGRGGGGEQRCYLAKLLAPSLTQESLPARAVGLGQQRPEQLMTGEIHGFGPGLRARLA